mgnify:CR=1 FL=1
MGDDLLSKSVQLKLERIQSVENWLASAGQKPFADIIGGARRSISSLTKTCSQLWHDNMELRKTADIAAAREASLRADLAVAREALKPIAHFAGGPFSMNAERGDLVSRIETSHGRYDLTFDHFLEAKGAYMRLTEKDTAP